VTDRFQQSVRDLLVRVIALFVAVLASASASAAQVPATSETGRDVIADIKVHGNRSTSSDDVVAIASLAIGQPFADGLIEAARKRLTDTGRFDRVEVLKRFASIEDPTRIAVVIIVDERPASVSPSPVPGGPPRVSGRKGPDHLMMLPIFWLEDGYGVTFGARLALVEAGTRRARVSFPLSWGGERRAGAEYDVTFLRGALSRVQAGVAIAQRENPAFEVADQRRRVHAGAERAIGLLSIGAQAAWEDVSFGESDDRLTSLGADATFDTRTDPYLARNAVYLRAAWTHLNLESNPDANRTEIEARGYVGLLGQSIAVVRWQWNGADESLPLFLKPLLGGWSSVRGFPAGWRAGDAMTTGSIEIRMPLNKTLDLAKVGVSVFADAGAVSDHGSRLSDQPIDAGAGAAVWLTATVFRVGVSVAHGSGYGTRVNFGGGFSF